MRRRVIQLEQGRIVRDERSGLLPTGPASGRFVRPLAESSPSGRGAAAAMKLGFFLKEALRALRRNAAPSLAAFATILITTLVLGVFIPVVRAATAKTNEVRNKIELEVFVHDDATKAEVTALGEQIRAIAARRELDFINKAEALAILREPPRQEVDDRRRPAGQPAAALLPDQARRPRQRRTSSRARSSPPARTASRSRSAPPSMRSRTARTTPTRSSRRPARSRSCWRRSRPAGARIGAAGRQHDPPLGIREQARGRGHEARRRDQLVHPLAVRDRGTDRRASSAAWSRSASSGWRRKPSSIRSPTASR